jgi:hypothetical protein
MWNSFSSLESFPSEDTTAEGTSHLVNQSRLTAPKAAKLCIGKGLFFEKRTCFLSDSSLSMLMDLVKTTICVSRKRCLAEREIELGILEVLLNGRHKSLNPRRMKCSIAYLGIVAQVG